jgi:hypothetical protein
MSLRERDIYERAVHAVIARTAAEIHRAGREGEFRPEPGGGMRGVWIALALSLAFWGFLIPLIRWLLS